MNYSKIISGTMNWGAWGSNLSTKKVADLIVNSIEFGINTFDNADIYGGYTTEELFGNGLAESGIERERIKIISKFGIMYPSDKLPIKVKHYDYSKGHIVKSIENSLKNLKTDYIDCVLLHRPSPLMDINEISDTIIDISELKVIDSACLNFCQWYEKNNGNETLSYENINLGSLFRVEFYNFLILNNMRCLQSPNPFPTVLPDLQVSVRFHLLDYVTYLQVSFCFLELVLTFYHFHMCHTPFHQMDLIHVLLLSLPDFLAVDLSHYLDSVQMAVHLYDHLLLVCIEIPFHSCHI